MKKTMSLTGLAALVAVTAFAPTAQADFPATPYRIAFVTSENPNPGDNIPADWDMADLNTWVTGLANDSGSLIKDLADEYYVVGATTLVDVYTNTGMDPAGASDIPIYLVGGLHFADNYADFWSSEPDTTITIYDGNKVVYYDEAGGTYSGPVQTGLNATGTTGSDPIRPITYVDWELDNVTGDKKVGQGGADTGYIYTNKGFYGNGDDWGNGGLFGGTRLFVVSDVIGGGSVAEPLLITGTSYAGPGSDFIINFTGAADTTYDVESSDDQLVGFAWIGVTATTDEFGVGTATVPDAMVGSGKDFFRMAE